MMTSKIKLVYVGILTSNLFVIQIIAKSRHHIDLQSIQKTPWNKWTIMWLYHISGHGIALHCIVFKKYKTFFVLIYSYINTSEIGKTRNCAETKRPQGAAQRTLTEEWRELFRVDIETGT